MLKDKWQESLPVQATCSERTEGTYAHNMILQPLQGFSDDDYLAGPLTWRDADVTSSGSTSEYSIPQQFDNQSHPENHRSETRPRFFGNPYGNAVEKIGSVSHDMVSQSQPSLVVRNTPVEEACKPINNVCSQMEDHKSFHPQKSCITDSEISLLGSNLQQLIIRFLSANSGPMEVPLETGTPQYLKLAETLQQDSVRLVEILQQSSIRPNAISDQLKGTNGGNEEGTTKEETTVPTSTHQSNVTSAEDESARDNQEKTLGHGHKNDLIFGVPKTDEKKLPPEKAARVSTEKLWEGSLQLSSSVTLSAVAYFKSGEKLLGNNWPESIEVKGKVRLEAFEKYVQDLPRSRNRGLMVTSVCWKEGSSGVGLTGMKEVAKGYQKSSRVGYAQLLSGIDLYICPRSNPIITILAKYGFFKGMSVIDDKLDLMIGCVVWRKNRPLNPLGNTSDNSIQPQNSPPVKNDAEKKPSPEKQAPESSQREADQNGGKSTSSSSPLQTSVSSDKLVRKRAFEDDDLPEFDFGNASGKSSVVSQSQSLTISSNSGLAAVNSLNCQKLDDSRLTQLPQVMKNIKTNSSKSSLEQSVKKIKLFGGDDDDMPEWCPPEPHKKTSPESRTSNFQTLRPPCPPPPRADTRPLFSYQPFQPVFSSLPPTLMGGPPPLPPPPPPLPPPSYQPLFYRPGSSNVHPSFQPPNRRRPQP